MSDSKKVGPNRWTRRFFTAGTAVLGFILILFTVFYAKTVSLKAQEEDSILKLRNLQFNYVSGVLAEELRDADKFSKELTLNIRKDIVSYYRDHPGKSLAYDLTNLNQNNNPVTNAIADNFRGQWLNNIENDNNDPWSAMSGVGIISDLSVNCSAAGRTRSFDEEYKLHAVPELAKKAVARILDQDPTLASEGRLDHIIGWSFLKPAKPEYVVEDFTLKNLREKFVKYGTLDTLASYEFLVPQYIDQDQDLVGVRTVSNRGLREARVHQIVIVSGFNLVDQFKAVDAHLYAYNNFETDIATIKDHYDFDIFMEQIFSFIIAVVFFICFGAVYSLEGTLEDKLRSSDE